jgi:hypothetical protein
MRKFILAATLAALAVPAIIPAISSAAPVGSTTCAAAGVPGMTYDGIPTTDVSGTVNSNLTVPAGAPLCRVFNATINGNTSVQGNIKVFGGTFNGNVSVTGGSFATDNAAVKINGNLSFVNPAVNSQNGFWRPAEVTGNLSYSITSDTVYPMYQSPLLYFGAPTQVDRSFNYSDLGTGFPGHLVGAPNVLNQH